MAQRNMPYQTFSTDSTFLAEIIGFFFHRICKIKKKGRIKLDLSFNENNIRFFALDT